MPAKKDTNTLMCTATFVLLWPESRCRPEKMKVLLLKFKWKVLPIVKNTVI